MKKEFEVSLQFVTYARVFIQAETEQEAEDIALSHDTLSGLAIEEGEWEVTEVEEAHCIQGDLRRWHTRANGQPLDTEE